MKAFRLFLRRLLWSGLVTLALFAAVIAWILQPPPERAIVFPDGKRFAFTIVDDTDMATLERNRPVYEVLHRYGLRTTKTVWVLDATETDHPANAGDSLNDPDYRAFIEDLRSKGFEIALHGVRGGSSERADIIAGLEEFRRLFGSYPRLHVNHSRNRDNLYWGSARWSIAPIRWMYALARDDELCRRGSGVAAFLGRSGATERQVRQSVHVQGHQPAECHAVISLSPAGQAAGQFLVSDRERRQS